MKKSAEWVDIALRFAGIVNVVWGLIFALFTDPLFRWAKLPEPPFLFPWQLIGVSAIVFGLGYYVASFNLSKHALVVVIGFTIKLASTIAVWQSVFAKDFALPMALYFSAKDLVWLAPFAMILYHIFKRWQAPEQERVNPRVPFSETISYIRTNQGHDLRSLSHEQPVLLVFLPASASPPFQTWMANLARQRLLVEQQGAKLVLAYGRDEAITSALRKYELSKEAYVNDADYALHSLFNLGRASLTQLLTAPLRRQSWTKKGAANELAVKSYRLPGVFLIYQGELQKMYRYEGDGDHPDLASLARTDY
ncbi:MAG: hypothetical protein WA960_03425 [Tunicatimonas sp.]